MRESTCVCACGGRGGVGVCDGVGGWAGCLLVWIGSTIK